VTRVRAASVLAIALAGPFAGGGARADTKPEPTGPDAAKADDLFKTAKDELKHGLTADACGHFAESARLAPGVGVTLYLADCYQRVGRTASAWTAFREAEALARTHKDKRADLAHHRAEVLEPKLNHLTIQVTGPAPAAPLEVTCDGRRIARDSWGTPVAIDPGEHVIVAQAGGWSRTYGASIDAKTSATTVTIELPAPETRAAPPARAIATEAPPATASPGPAAPPAPEPAAAASPPPAAEGSGSAHVWLTVSLGAVGVAGLGIGTVYGILATSHRNQSNAGPCDASDYCSPSGLSLRQQALSEATVSTVAFIAGLAAVAGAGAAYFLTAGPSSEPSRTGVTVSPTVTAGGAGALFRGAF
jgi:hypothetical protein